MKVSARLLALLRAPGSLLAAELLTEKNALRRQPESSWRCARTNARTLRGCREKYTGETYIQHNPEVADGKESFIAYFEKQAKDYPGKRFEFRRVLAEGKFVVVHTWSIFPEMWRNKEWAGIDIFRLDERGKIVEHWDVLQTIPSSAANKNGMF